MAEETRTEEGEAGAQTRRVYGHPAPGSASPVSPTAKVSAHAAIRTVRVPVWIPWPVGSKVTWPTVSPTTEKGGTLNPVAAKAELLRLTALTVTGLPQLLTSVTAWGALAHQPDDEPWPLCPKLMLVGAREKQPEPQGFPPPSSPCPRLPLLEALCGANAEAARAAAGARGCRAWATELTQPTARRALAVEAGAGGPAVGAAVPTMGGIGNEVGAYVAVARQAALERPRTRRGAAPLDADPSHRTGLAAAAAVRWVGGKVGTVHPGGRAAGRERRRTGRCAGRGRAALAGRAGLAALAAVLVVGFGVHAESARGARALRLRSDASDGADARAVARSPRWGTSCRRRRSSWNPSGGWRSRGRHRFGRAGRASCKWSGRSRAGGIDRRDRHLWRRRRACSRSGCRSHRRSSPRCRSPRRSGSSRAAPGRRSGPSTAGPGGKAGRSGGRSSSDRCTPVPPNSRVRLRPGRRRRSERARSVRSCR